MTTTLFLRAALFALLLAVLPPAAAANEPPRTVRASYELLRNNLLLARVEETFTWSEGKYRIESRTTPEGLAQFFTRDQILRTSNGRVTEAGLQPLAFEERRVSPDKERRKAASFDWDGKRVTLSHDDESKQVALPAGTQDWASLFYQFMFAPPDGKPVTIEITDGRRLESYRFVPRDETPLATRVGSFDAVHYSRDPEGERKVDIWLARDRAWLTLRMVMREGDAVTEQRLVSLSTE